MISELPSHMRRTLRRENFTSARRRRAISLSMLKVPNDQMKRLSNNCSDRMELEAKICELVALKLLSSLTLWNNEVIAAEKDHLN